MYEIVYENVLQKNITISGNKKPVTESRCSMKNVLQQKIITGIGPIVEIEEEI